MANRQIYQLTNPEINPLNYVVPAQVSTGASEAIKISISQIAGLTPITNNGTSIVSTIPYTSQTGEADGIYIGSDAGAGAPTIEKSIMLGYRAGRMATYAGSSVFIGPYAGLNSAYAYDSVFLGDSAGYQAYSASYSVMIGTDAGGGATNAYNSIMIGNAAGYSASEAGSSILIGNGAGRTLGSDNIGSNNIIIGNYVTLASGSSNSINIGGLIFGSGMMIPEGGVAPGPVPYSKVGIGTSDPQYTLHVSGTVAIDKILHMVPCHPLPSGNIGDLAVSASHLWFFNGAWSQLD